MKKVGVLGRNGFLGDALSRHLKLFPEKFVEIESDRKLFADSNLMDEFVCKCDVIVNLAGLNRLEDLNIVYQTNIGIVKSLIDSLERTKSKPHVIFSSTIHEDRDEFYGKSKKTGRELLAKWSKNSGAIFTGLVIPNVFGPFGKPFYNSVVATFCHQLTHNGVPEINVDGVLRLVYVDEVIQTILDQIDENTNLGKFKVSYTTELKVSEVLQLLNIFKNEYLDNGNVPSLNSKFELQLFNTFRSFIDLKNHYPVLLTQHTDNRGSFVEIIRPEIGGQFSFSTTVPGITRGNHFHTRKIERFTVIKGKALIQLRKIGTNEVLNFELDGEIPSYVDMPIWYTHNIKNIGSDVLYTNFWINEAYDPDNADTYFQEV
ncbi:NAD-dependent epimerase/dehydratase family protein [Flavobacterium sp.]|uniref:polysaccharide biosynthesis C-terminal domain-containing protein n=1 Tax=Flavobacterium sp. TaxID=239 RepID=UPI002A7FA2DE|nr:NAD-dependent epimerase/dehydratase family protein [Flavobacterium sp.]